MKIFTLPVDPKLQPHTSPIAYPPHNGHHGVEQDFPLFLNQNPQLKTSNPTDADFHYLPIYWTNWHLWHDYAKKGLDELIQLVHSVIIDDAKTFTICQYDDGPVGHLGKTIQFLASRNSESGIDIPLLSAPHRQPWFKPKKKFKASFIGRLNTHIIREKMAVQLKKYPNIYIDDTNSGTRHFVRKTLQSYVALSPRGYGGSSFRFFEAMQLGVVPYLIGEPDTRPFKRFIHWDTMSLYSRDTSELESKLNYLSSHELLQLGDNAKQFWYKYFSNQSWCQFILMELENYQ